MYCEKCGSPVADNAPFCPICGAPQEPIAPAAPAAPAYTQPAGQQQSYSPAQPQAAEKTRSRRPLLIAAVIVLALITAAGAVGGILVRNSAGEAHGGRPESGQSAESGKQGGSGAPQEGGQDGTASLSAGETYQDGEVAISLENALIWTRAENFLSPGFRYAQIWVHMENNGSEAVTAPAANRFFIHYDGDIPQWMRDYKAVYGDDILNTEFGAEDRANIIGDVTEGEASGDGDYYSVSDSLTIASGDTLYVYLLYMIPEDAENATVYYYASEAAAKQDEAPLAVFRLKVDSERAALPDSQVIRYDDPAAAAEAASTYKRPDQADYDGLMTYYGTEDELRDFAQRNNDLYITEPKALNGGWIGMIDYYDDDVLRYFNTELAISPDGSATLTVDWYQLYDEWEKTHTDETGRDNTVFTGTWNGGSGTMDLSADGVGDIRFFMFCGNERGVQYALGRFTPANEETAYLTPSFNMIRPGWSLEEWMNEEMMAGLKENVTYSDLAPADWTVDGLPSAPEPEPEPEPAPQPTYSFTDVNEGDWYYPAVSWAAEHGIVAGGAFSPNDTASRAQALTFLWRAKGEPAPVLTVSPFTDVSNGDYYYEPVLWAFENGMISTADDGKFHPNDSISRGQIITFLYRAEDGSASGLSNPFTDAREGSWYYEPALWAYSCGIIGTESGGKFNANSSCTRAQIVTFLWRAYDPGATLAASVTNAPSGAHAVDTSNVGLPSDGEFEWFYTVLDSSELPPDAALLYDGAEVSGKWKALFLFIEGGEVSVQYLSNITIYAGDVSATVIVDPYQVNFGEGWYADSGNDYSYSGRYDEDGTVSCYGDYGSIELEYFYSCGGKQYGVGLTTVQSGETAYVALVRP